MGTLFHSCARATHCSQITLGRTCCCCCWVIIGEVGWCYMQVNVALQLGTPFQPFHQHLMFMLDGVMPKADRRIFNSLSSTSAVVDFLRDYCGVTQHSDTSGELSDAMSTVGICSENREIVNRWFLKLKEICEKMITVMFTESLLSHAGSSRCRDNVISGVCDCVCVCLHTPRGKWLELSTPNLIHKYYVYALSHSYENCHCRIIWLLVKCAAASGMGLHVVWLLRVLVILGISLSTDLHMAQLIPLLLTVFCFSKIQICLPFWYRLTRVVLDKGPLNGCCFCCLCQSML